MSKIAKGKKTPKLHIEKQWTYVNNWYIIIPLIFMGAFFLIPLAKVFILSFFPNDGSGFSIKDYIYFLTDPFYLKVLFVSLALGLASTIVCLLMGYPIAYHIARTKGQARSIATAAVMLPLWVSVIIRMYGWMALLTKDGLVNSVLQFLHLVNEPISFIGNYSGVLIGLVHCGLPFMIMTLISPIENVDRNLEDASYVFGGGFMKTFFKVTLPLTIPGVMSGSLLVFALNTAAFVVPMMLGSGKFIVMTTLMRQQALFVFDWPFTAAIAVILFTASIILVWLSRKISKDNKLVY